MPKYMEFHYRIKASTGGFGSAANTVSSVIGIILSGWVIGRWRFKARTMAAFCVFADLCAIIGFSTIVIYACPTSQFPGTADDLSR